MMSDQDTLTWNSEHERTLRALTVDENGPGTILREISADADQRGWGNISELIGREGDKVVSIPLPRIDIPRFRFGERTFRQWQELGHDRGSRVADPRFAAPGRDDYSLRSSSPALAMGFRAFDVSTVGPRTR